MKETLGLAEDALIAVIFIVIAVVLIAVMLMAMGEQLSMD
jgi:hypothetical protein